MVSEGRSLARMTIRWMTASIDRPADPFDNAVEFWMETTGTKLSSARGDHKEFATLLPPGGDAYLRVQRVGDCGGSHLDLHVDDVESFVRRAHAMGAHVEHPPGGPPLIRSPAGMVACVVNHHGESIRPGALMSPQGAVSIVDQLCIDVPEDRFDEECAFWSGLTGWVLQSSSSHPEFKFLIRPAWSPLRLLLQRREDSDGPARSHLDIACDDVKLLVDDHLRLGAFLLEEFANWTCMIDPAGLPYCITRRNPHTGLLSTPTPDYGP